MYKSMTNNSYFVVNYYNEGEARWKPCGSPRFETLQEARELSRRLSQNTDRTVAFRVFHFVNA